MALCAPALAATAAFARWLPVRRAAAVDPSVTFRESRHSAPALRPHERHETDGFSFSTPRPNVVPDLHSTSLDGPNLDLGLRAEGPAASPEPLREE